MIYNHTDFAPPERLSKEETINQYKKLIQSTFFNKELFDKIPIIILILNQFRQIIFVNEYFKKITKITDIEEVIGYRPGEVFQCQYAYINPAGCGTSKFCRYCGAVNAILTSLKGVRDLRECDILLKNGDALNLLVSADKIKFNGDEYIIFTLQDIKEQKELQYIEKSFLSMLKESIFEIKLASDMLKTDNDNELVDEISRLSKEILQNIDLQKLMVDAETYNLEIHLAEINSIEFLLELIEKFNFSGKKVIIDEGAESINFKTDYYLLYISLYQIINNAINVRFEDEQVKISVKKEEDKVKFIIKNKRYIPDSIKYVMFKRSYSKEIPGHGLGAYIARLICKRYLKGEIEFSSDKEKGSTFYIIIPEDLSKEVKNAS